MLFRFWESGRTLRSPRHSRHSFQFYVLNLYYISKEALKIAGGIVADIWVNSYVSYYNMILDNSDEGLFFRVPIENLRVRGFMNWDSNPLEVEK